MHYHSVVSACFVTMFVLEKHQKQRLTKIGVSYENDAFDLTFLFRDCVMRVMEL